MGWRQRPISAVSCAGACEPSKGLSEPTLSLPGPEAGPSKGVSAAITTIRLPRVPETNSSCYDSQPTTGARVAVKLLKYVDKTTNGDAGPAFILWRRLQTHRAERPVEGFYRE